MFVVERVERGFMLATTELNGMRQKRSLGAAVGIVLVLLITLSWTAFLGWLAWTSLRAWLG
jgi:hypothetical protein